MRQCINKSYRAALITWLSEGSESSDEDVCLEDTSKRKNIREDEEKESKKRIKMFVQKVQETSVIVISDSE